ncbi:MAG: hypothetical protein ACRD1Z_13910, partial [Vicinamibacteria bacterium]
MLKRFAAVVMVAVSLPLALSHAEFAAPGSALRSFEFTYKAEVKDIPEGAGRVAVWIPYPVSDPHQEITDVKVTSPYTTRVEKDGKFGNSILFLETDRPAERAFTVEV